MTKVRQLDGIKYIDMTDEGELTHRQIGQKLGESIGDDVEGSLKAHFADVDMDNAKALKIFYILWKKADELFPKYLDELKGVAEGSGQDFEKIVRFSFEEELYNLENTESEGYSPKHCSSLSLKTKDGIVLAHNEDWDLDLLPYVLKAKPKNEPKFLCVSYAGQSPGQILGLNEYGMAFGANSVETDISFNGLSKGYILRSLLEAKNMEHAINLTVKKPRNMGANTLIVDGKTQEMAKFEWAQEAYRIILGDDYLFHTNNFTTEDLAKYDIWEEEGFETFEDCARYKAFRHLLNKIGKHPSLADAMRIMRSHRGKPDSICKHRVPSEDMDIRTVCCAIVNPAKGIMYFSPGNPCRKKFRGIVL